MYNNLDAYAKSVATLASRRESHLFFNEGNEHALIVFENIFRNARKNLHIVANDLTNAEVCNHPDYIESLGAYLAQDGVTLGIILSHADEGRIRNAPVFQTIYNSSAYKAGNVKLYNLNGKQFKNNNETVHFCFADGMMYRIETDTIHRKAQCNFNDPTTVKALQHNFKNGVGLATVVDLSQIYAE